MSSDSKEDKKDATEMFEIKESREKESKQSDESSSYINKNSLKNLKMLKTSQIEDDNFSNEEEDEEEEEEEDELEEELFEAFGTLDEDHSGLVTKEELFNFMRKIGHRPSDLELREIMEVVSREHPGGISFQDFKNILNKQIKDELTLNTTKEAFGVFDKMMKGKIKKEDLKNILMTRGEQNMTEEEIKDLIEHYVEYDENGEVNYNNFVKNTFELFK
jgi:Ca2+-binding EF-hand superfamily protein